jgi:hypothetical protein
VKTPQGIISTGDTKVGSFIGDHTKTSIGVLLNTGSWIGIMCNLMSTDGVLPKHIPSFVWYVGGRMTKGLGFAPMLKTAEVSMSRRKMALTEAMVELLGKVRERTKAPREELIKKDRRRR